MKIVGICGDIGSGKSTFAELLTSIDPGRSVHLETSQVIVELADTFNAALGHVDRDKRASADNLALSREPIRALLPIVSRMAGRTLANEALDIEPADKTQNYQWYEKLDLYIDIARRSPTLLDQPITAENKSAYRPLLQWIGGYVLYKLENNLLWYEELLRRIALAGPDVQLAALTAPRQPAEADYIRQWGGSIVKLERPALSADKTDVTERLASAIVPDAEILNNGTVDDLARIARQVREDLFANHLSSSYQVRT